ncbi:uncharacterized protein [Polyergus mexicanus]|uniref:uncharacterized protein n=1 Tax=Polyergus mexicanus TaxID=615972 RepID=UPI0038B6369A
MTLNVTDAIATCIFFRQDPKIQVRPVFCDKIGKQLKASRSRSRDLECPPTTLPTCYQCSRYPPGCIVLECRSEADRPVVRVVQVLAEATARNSCPPVKTRSTFDPRMTSRCEGIKQQSGSIDVRSWNRTVDKFILLPASRILKSQDYANDSVALTDKIPIEAVSTAFLNIDRDEKQPDDTFSKIVYDRSRNQPVIFIECAATPCEEPASNIQCSTNTAVSCQKSKLTSSRPDYKFACSNQKIDISSEIKDPFSQITCRNDLDSSEISSFSKKSLKRFRRRVCPIRCCQPVRQSAIGEACKDFLRAKSSASDAISSPTCVGKDDQRSLDEQLQCPASERMLPTHVTRVESAKSDKASACQGSAIDFKRACLIPGGISEDTSRLSSSQELLARHKEHIPIHLLERYEICRSKRNGLQDECVLPLLQALLKKEKEGRFLNNCIEYKRNIDRLDADQNRISESMNHDQKLKFYYI